MRVGFFTQNHFPHSVNTPLNRPLEGSESAMCYLSKSLAEAGHEVILYGDYSRQFMLGKVLHKPKEFLQTLPKERLDFLINQNRVSFIPLFKERAHKTKIILWEHYVHDAEITPWLSSKKIRDSIDQYVFVSNWQMKEFIKAFSIKSEKCKVIGNGVSPAFLKLFPKEKPILKEKKLLLVYTSSPHRGLDILLNIFPSIIKRFPETRLKVFSGIKGMYNLPDNFEHLYDLCRKTPGVEYIGPVSQKRLARELKPALVLAYPVAIWETFCINAVEAMTAGCHVITNALGALPETTAGFADLIEVDNVDPQEYINTFINLTINCLNSFKSDRDRLEKSLREQVDFCYHNYTWELKAQEWEEKIFNG